MAADRSEDCCALEILRCPHTVQGKTQAARRTFARQYQARGRGSTRVTDGRLLYAKQPVGASTQRLRFPEPRLTTCTPVVPVGPSNFSRLAHPAALPLQNRSQIERRLTR
jgi:hypothetical protein